MENCLTEILYNYPIHVRRILTLKSGRVWEIQCTEGTYILKALSFPARETAFIIGAMDHLSAKGFTSFNQIIPDIDQEKIIVREEKSYFLSAKLPGGESDYQDPVKVKACAEFLAGFHQAAQGYKPQNPYPGRVKWGSWPLMIEEKRQDLNRFLEYAGQKTSFDCCYRRFAPFFAEEMVKTGEFFKASQYPKICQEEKTRGGFCHHDLAHHNFVMADAVNIIDFDYAIADIRCHDLANFLSKIMKANNWSTTIAWEALTAYDKKNPLKKEEPKILKAMLQFPQDFWQCGLARYGEQDFSEHNEKKLRRLLKQRNQRFEALKFFNQNF